MNFEFVTKLLFPKLGMPSVADAEAALARTNAELDAAYRVANETHTERDWAAAKAIGDRKERCQIALKYAIEREQKIANETRTANLAEMRAEFDMLVERASVAGTRELLAPVTARVVALEQELHRAQTDAEAILTAQHADVARAAELAPHVGGGPLPFVLHLPFAKALARRAIFPSVQSRWGNGSRSRVDGGWLSPVDGQVVGQLIATSATAGLRHGED